MRDIEHVNEDAELYALGTLGVLEAARVERHVRICDECARRVGEAEATVLCFVDESATGDRAGETTTAAARAPLFPRGTASRLPAVAAAAAVAAILAFGLTMVFAPVRERPAGVADRPALEAMLAGHFLHAPFAGRIAGAPAAKVIYAREGGWIYVIAAPGAHALDVVAVTSGRRLSISSLEPSDRVRSRFATIAGRADTVELVDRGVAVATAHLAYPRR